ncbi:ferrous iron transport protein A [Alkaliphilus sp. MSJ-5]|uniref:Ferrous iron transport protein A n=2 Tax=Alkaliphilus flagellatus TaxID=2841507 RepID=A0ABS6G3G0_9FIRM|nr:ferrous iron transport protein A [Alkaliphilus flagellatus]
MYIQSISLSKMPVGSKVQILNLLSTGLPRRRMLDLGLIPGTIIEIIRKSPLGDPIAYNIRGAMIALRKEESDQILVKLIS